MEILVIINSVVLVIFLLIAIIAGIKLVVVLRQVQRVVQKAEDAADTVESVGKAIKEAVVPLGAVKIVSNIFEHVTRQKSSKKRR